ncbi:MAG: TrkH family potassium uptake protein [Alphaproteobacteria bacterium]|nr:TrkH family potassium uptake protein [Alphaproteobacteria bacterium]HRI75454.1 TrkH family potassium uptake protein [Alphaproteobacteria bacterium]
MSFKPVFYIIGILLLILSAAMLLPALVDLAHESGDWKVFASAQLITAFVGFALIFSNREKSFALNLRQTFVLASISWIFMTAFAALPFCFAEIQLSYTRAFFEAMSGLTTTGATVITGLDDLPKGILLWRAMLQWLGGIGFLVVALAVLPLLQVSGMQIFKTQSFGMEKVLPSAQQMALYILTLYFVLTLACALLLFAADMSLFDAFCHAMTSVATGGFANYDASIGHFNSPTIDWIVIVFMWLGALPFVQYVRMLKGNGRAVVDDAQVRAFFGILLSLSMIVAFFLLWTGQKTFFDAVRSSIFMLTTLMTTSGFASGDYSKWGPLAEGVAFVAMYLGACSGSTAGGIKTFRLQILWAMVQQQVRRLIVPHGVFQVHYNNKVVDNDVLMSVAVFFFVHILTWMAVTILLHLTGLDFTTAVSGAISAVSNVGPGLGPIIGPSGTFATLDADAIWILSIAMLLGRMEFLTMFVLLAPRFWRD